VANESKERNKLSFDRENEDTRTVQDERKNSAPTLPEKPKLSEISSNQPLPYKSRTEQRKLISEYSSEGNKLIRVFSDGSKEIHFSTGSVK